MSNGSGKRQRKAHTQEERRQADSLKQEGVDNRITLPVLGVLVLAIAIASAFFLQDNGRVQVNEGEGAVEDVVYDQAHYPVRFKNLRSYAVDVWWLDEEAFSIVHQYSLAPGEQTSTLGEAGQKFFFSPKDDPSEQLQMNEVGHSDQSDNLFVLEDANNSQSALMRKWREEKTFRGEYRQQTGKLWLGYYPRSIPAHFMWPTQNVGDVTILTTTEGHFKCIPMTDRSCKPDDSLTLSIEVMATEPKVLSIENFLSALEADHLVQLGANRLQRSKTSPGAQREGPTVSSVRTSSNTWVPRETDAITERIFQRLAAVAKIRSDMMVHTYPHGVVEAMQLVHYKAGQEYRAHYDWWVSENKAQHSRFMTFLLYLNDQVSVAAGGETKFPMCKCKSSAATNCSIALHPGKGGAAFFYNLLEDGNPDGLSMHAAAPVVEGEKWLANVWVWDPQLGGRR